MLRHTLLSGLASLVLVPAAFAGIIDASHSVTSNLTASYTNPSGVTSTGSGSCGSGLPAWVTFNCTQSNSTATVYFGTGSGVYPGGSAHFSGNGMATFTFTGDLFLADGSSPNVAFDMTLQESVGVSAGHYLNPVLTIDGATVPITSTLVYYQPNEVGHMGTWHLTADTNVATGVLVPYTLTYSVQISASAGLAPDPSYSGQFTINGINGEPVPSATPEPGSMAAMASGLVALAGFGLRRRRASR